MKAQIRDAAVLRLLQPLDVAAYLRANGWKEIERIQDRVSVWTQRSASKKAFEIELPLDRGLADFASRMGDMLRVLEVAEARSQIEVLHDLTTSPADLIRIRALYAETADGTIPLEAGISLIQRGREMLLAAACATVEPRAYYATRKPTPAIEYLEKVRLGQTERGSYVVTLISRVPPGLEPDKNGKRHLDVADPFERRVTKTLARSLVVARQAAQTAMATGTLDAFQDGVAEGVSANLCDAVAAMAGGPAEPRDIEVSFTWSRSRPLETVEPRQIRVTADAIPAIAEAGRIFRERSPRADFELVGLVTTLDRPQLDRPGRATIYGLVDEANRKVGVELSGADYDFAIRAHKELRPIRCAGQLVRSGRAYELHLPHSLEWSDA